MRNRVSKLQIKEGEIHLEIKHRPKIIFILQLKLKKTNKKTFSTAVGKIIKKYPSHSIYYGELSKKAPEFEMKRKVLKEMNFLHIGKKIVYNKKLQKKKANTTLTFVNGKHKNIKPIMKRIFTQNMKQSPFISDYIDILNPAKSFEEFVINKSKPEWNFIALQGHKIIGYFSLSKIQYKGTYGTINHIGIKQNQQGKGYSTALLNKAQEILIEEGIKEYRGSTDEQNKSMKKAFKKFGCAYRNELHIYAYKPEKILRKIKEQKRN